MFDDDEDDDRSLELEEIRREEAMEENYEAERDRKLEEEREIAAASPTEGDTYDGDFISDRAAVRAGFPDAESYVGFLHAMDRDD